MLESGLLRAATRWASLGWVLLWLAACGDPDGGVTAAAPSPGRGSSGRVGESPEQTAEVNDLPDAASTTSWFVPLQNAPAPLITPTYDGSGQAVEPTVLFFANGWRGHHYWMAMSPYPKSKAYYENPSILVSEDGLSWSPPQGLTNPLATADQGALADGTIVYDDSSDELWMYYLEELRDGGDGGVHWQLLRRMTSNDGVHWSPWTQLLEGMPYPLESPSVVKRGGEFFMWTVNIGPGGCTAKTSDVLERSSADGVHWNEPAVTNISIPGYVVWHLNMTQVGQTGRLLAAITAFRQGLSCHQTELFLAYTEGENWVTMPKPVVSHGPPKAWDGRLIYRSSFLYDEAQDRLRAWYSAQSQMTIWHVGYTEGKLVLPP
jgi:hypothetical protein